MKTSRTAFSILMLITNLLLLACTEATSFKEIGKNLTIFPDYTGIIIPPNIAPLNFVIREKADRYLVKVHGSKGNELKVTSSQGKIDFPLKKWKALLGENRGGTITLDFMLKRDGQWFKYKSITNRVADENIDSYLVYRLIEPGYETWNKMGIYQRDLESFDEQPIMKNDMSGGNCMNCHSFCQNSNNIMLFHMRAKNGGTYLYINGKVKKVDTKTDSTISAGVYPSWHSGGRYVAFSVNRIVQTFHALPDRKIEVIDTLSDLIVYDTRLNKVYSNSSIASQSNYETFPTWSPDGKYLYFCSANVSETTNPGNMKYNLLRIAFDTSTLRFGQTDTVIAASRNGYSVSFPRISPDGKILMFCKTSYGNFTIWHDDSDIYTLDLTSLQISKPNINSDRSESYHTWASSGRWMVFSSRRLDGLYTRPFFTYIDKKGKAYKPFLLPQRDPEFYDDFLKSYNVPELVKAKVNLDPRQLEKITKLTPEQATFQRI